MEMTYLGDGVYANEDGYHINLAVNHHTNHAVSLEPAVIVNLLEYIGEVMNCTIKAEPKP